MPYDPTIYLGSAAHYRYGRPAYSPELEAILTQEAGLDPDASMLAEGCRAAADKPVGQSFHWTDEQRVAETVYDPRSVDRAGHHDVGGGYADSGLAAR